MEEEREVERDEEYNDTLFIIKHTPTQSNPTQPNPTHKNNEETTDTLRLTQEFNEKFFALTKKSIYITNLSIIIDDIKNYRPLTDLQITQLESLTKEERLKVIKTFNTMFLSLESLLQ